jgi:CheY-like chemotaxis protein
MARILVVDDDLPIQGLLQEALTSAGHQVFIADDGEAAMSLYRKCHPDLVITDIFMPERDGLAVVLALAAEDAKIIAMSGGGAVWHSCHLNDAVAFGAAAVLTKPFTVAKLRKTVDDVLASGSEARIPSA